MISHQLNQKYKLVFMIFNLIILLLNYLHINPSCFEMMSFMDGFLPNLPIGIFGLKCFFFNFAALISHQLDQRQKLEQRLEAGNSELQTLTRNAHGLKVLLEARTKFIQTGVVDVSNNFTVFKFHAFCRYLMKHYF